MLCGDAVRRVSVGRVKEVGATYGHSCSNVSWKDDKYS